MTKEEAITAIKAVHPNSTYANNVVGATLRAVAATEGVEVADAIIRKLGLTRKFGIQEQGAAK